MLDEWIIRTGLWWTDTDRVRRTYPAQNLSHCHMSTTNPTLTGLGSNPGQRGDINAQILPYSINLNCATLSWVCESQRILLRHNICLGTRSKWLRKLIEHTLRNFILPSERMLTQSGERYFAYNISWRRKYRRTPKGSITFQHRITADGSPPEAALPFLLTTTSEQFCYSPSVLLIILQGYCHKVKQWISEADQSAPQDKD